MATTLMVAAAAAGAARGARAQDSALAGLPLQEFPAATDGRMLGILMTGDGGFRPFDRQLATGLAAEGIAVIGMNSRAYLENPRTPDQAAADVGRIANVYLAKWHRSEVVLVGYSRGADMAPFILARWPDTLRRRVKLVAMIGLTPNANFHFHLIDLVRDEHRPDDLATMPEVERLRGLPMLCFYGEGEDDTACRGADTTLMRPVVHRGGHRVTSDGDMIVRRILDALR